MSAFSVAGPGLVVAQSGSLQAKGSATVAVLLVVVAMQTPLLPAPTVTSGVHGGHPSCGLHFLATTEVHVQRDESWESSCGTEWECCS